MARPPRPPRRCQAQFFAALRETPAEFKAAAFGAHLRAADMGDRSRVSRLETGDEHLRFDELDALLTHLGRDAVHALDILASRHGCVVMRTPEVEDRRSSVELLALRIEKLTGDLSGEVVDARDPDGEGGAVITDCEGRRIRQHLQAIHRSLAAVEQALPPNR